VSECGFDWTCAYRISEAPDCRLQVGVRLRLEPASKIEPDELEAAQKAWRSAIENAWTGCYQIRRTEGSCPCESYVVTVVVQFVETDQHHTVRVWSGHGPADMTNWHIGKKGETTAHEVGHMFGYADEYRDDKCPDRTVYDDGTIMGASRIGTVHLRHYFDFAKWISIETGCDYEVFA
jgi:hypothetical protein